MDTSPGWDNTLEIRDTANFDMEDINYDIRILDSPEKMQELIIERNRTSHNRSENSGWLLLELEKRRSQ